MSLWHEDFDTNSFQKHIIMIETALQVRTKNQVGPVVNVPHEPQDGAWFELEHAGRWFRGHVTNLTYRYTSEDGIDATLFVIVTIDAVTWGTDFDEDDA